MTEVCILEMAKKYCEMEVFLTKTGKEKERVTMTNSFFRFHLLRMTFLPFTVVLHDPYKGVELRAPHFTSTD